MKDANWRHATGFLLGLVGVLLFTVGVLVGQQAQRSKLGKYLQPTTVTAMQLALINANLDIIRSNVGAEDGVHVAEVYYDAATRSVRGFAVVNEELTRQPVAKVRERLLLKAYSAISDTQRQIPEVSEKAFTMTFRDFSSNAIQSYADGGKPKEFAEYVNGELIFK
jgi:hypothetical protein